MKECEKLKESMYEHLSDMAKLFSQSKKPTAALNYNIYITLKNLKMLKELVKENDHEAVTHHEEKDKKGMWS